MSTIKVKMKNGTTREWVHKEGAGIYASSSNSVKYEGGFAVIVDARGKKTAIPSHDIESITEEPVR